MTTAEQTKFQCSRQEQDGTGARVKRTTRPAPTAYPSSQQPKKGNALILTIIIDDDELFRAGIARLLCGRGFRVAFDGGRLEDLLTEKFQDRAAVVVVGLGKEPKAELSQLPLLRQACKHLRIAILSDRFRLEEMITAIKAGARGYFIRGSTSPEVLLKSLELIALGRIVLPEECGEALEHCPRCEGDGKPIIDNEEAAQASKIATSLEASLAGTPSKLSNREQMILQQLTQGATNKHIARSLAIAEATVKVHLKSLLRKIQVTNRTQAAMWARDHSSQASDPIVDCDEVLGRNSLGKPSIGVGIVSRAVNGKTESDALMTIQAHLGHL